MFFHWFCNFDCSSSVKSNKRRTRFRCKLVRCKNNGMHLVTYKHERRYAVTLFKFPLWKQCVSKAKTISRLCLKQKARGFKRRKCETKPERQTSHESNEHSRFTLTSGDINKQTKWREVGKRSTSCETEERPAVSGQMFDRGTLKSTFLIPGRGRNCHPNVFRGAGTYLCGAPRPARMIWMRSGAHEGRGGVRGLRRDYSTSSRHHHSFLQNPKPTSHPSFTGVHASLPPCDSVEGVLVVGQRSYEHFGEGVCSRAADVALGGVKRHVVDGLFELLPVSGELLNTRLALHVPKTHGAVVTWDEYMTVLITEHTENQTGSAWVCATLTARHQIESVWIHGETGHSIQMSHHWVNQLT